MDRNVDIVHVRLLGGVALDLAGDGGSASDVPSFRYGVPGQQQRPFGVIGISMPARDLLVVSLKNKLVIRGNSADVYSIN